jgi:hypothetical protein
MRRALVTSTATAVSLLAQCAHAHPGHDMPTASHWHPTDVGLLLVAVLAGAAYLFMRGK